MAVINSRMPLTIYSQEDNITYLVYELPSSERFDKRCIRHHFDRT